MKYFHSVLISVYIKPEDSADQVKERFLSLFSEFDLEKEKIEVRQKKADIMEGRSFLILSLKLLKQRHVHNFLKTFFSRFNSEHYTLLKSQLESRVDEEGNFFLRLDKKELIEKDEFLLVDHGDCFHCKLHVASYPQGKEKSIAILKSYFEDLDNNQK